MDFNELKNFDVSDLSRLGSAPMAIKSMLIALLFALLLGLGYYFDTSIQLTELSEAEQQEAELKKTFERKHQKSANLEAYKIQLEEMERDFGAMLRQLPSETEIPAVILDVSQTGLASGLKIELFKPQSDVYKEFYAEKPIQIRVSGTYQQMAKFSSGIAALPRIVTLHNIQLKPVKDGKLIMDVTAKTYRYLPDQEG
ncbi:MAG TPA: pilus assembly protein PilO [Gammaproteobacteria bacterium]|nr:pilus assembly protein PilO [Gammaproteobacteria bacterium]